MLALRSNCGAVLGRRGITKLIKVVLLQDVERLGFIGDVVEVKTGRARNYLIPSKAAVYATREKVTYHKDLITAAETAKAERDVLEREQLELKLRRKNERSDSAASDEMATFLEKLKTRREKRWKGVQFTNQPNLPIDASYKYFEEAQHE